MDVSVCLRALVCECMCMSSCVSPLRISFSPHRPFPLPLGTLCDTVLAAIRDFRVGAKVKVMPFTCCDYCCCCIFSHLFIFCESSRIIATRVCRSMFTVLFFSILPFFADFLDRILSCLISVSQAKWAAENRPTLVLPAIPESRKHVEVMLCIFLNHL